MSLINDALKKASHAEKQKQAANPSAVPQPAVAPPMQAAEPRPTSSFPIAVPVLVVVLLLGVGAFGVVKLMGNKPAVENKTTAPVVQKENVPVPTPQPVQVAAVAKPAPVATPVVTAAAVAQPTKVQSPVVATAEPVAATPPTPQPEPVAAVPAPPPVPKFPVIKLQGIFYKKNDPTAMLNGETLSVGGKVDGVVVTKIQQSAVTLEWNGETKVLELR